MEEVKRYRCVKEFEVENYDDDCSRIDGEYTTIKPGGIWQDGGHSFNICEVHLENEDAPQWIEVPTEYLSEYFEQIEGEQ